MRIVLHDYSGHPFQVGLSRELARRGHDVLHIHSAVFQTPKGDLVRRPDDPTGFEVEGIRTRKPFAKHSFVRRRAQEIEIGKAIGRRIRAFRPDVVLSSNAPLDCQSRILRAARDVQAGFVFWLQDIYSEAIGRILSDRLGLAGKLIGAHYRRLEFGMLAASEHVVAIAQDFADVLCERGIARRQISVVENWASLDEIAQRPRDNAWARANMPHRGARIVYSGTLGYKHNPRLLIEVARAVDAHVYVFSEGPAAEQLRREAVEEGVNNLTVAPWVPYERLPDMLGGADLFVAMIEEDAGAFSVPSKVLSYMCAGRPIVAAIPRKNLAHRLIEREGVGLVCDSRQADVLPLLARRLIASPGERIAMGKQARAYAERAFDLGTIADRFESVLEAAAKDAGARKSVSFPLVLKDALK